MLLSLFAERLYLISDTEWSLGLRSVCSLDVSVVSCDKVLLILPKSHMHIFEQ